MNRSFPRFRGWLLGGVWAGVLAISALAGIDGSPASAQTAGSFGKNKIAYRRFDWHIYHSPHFNLYYYTAEEPLLEKVASLAESAYDRLSRDFNFQIKEPVPLIFYATHSAFEQNNVIQNFIPEGVGAFASPARFRMVLPVDLADSELMELILHELTHIFQYKILFQGRLAEAATTSPPTWFMEGMASYMAKDESSRDKMFLRDAVVNDQIPSVGQDFGGFFAYRFGHAVFDFIEDRWGKDGFLDFVYEARNALGSRVDRAVKRTFKLDVEDFDADRSSAEGEAGGGDVHNPSAGPPGGRHIPTHGCHFLTCSDTTDRDEDITQGARTCARHPDPHLEADRAASNGLPGPARLKPQQRGVTDSQPKGS